MHLEKNWLDQIQNGRLSAIIYFHISDQIQNGRLSAIIYFHIAGF